MTNEEFSVFVNLFLDSVQDTLTRKGNEYAPVFSDRFTNFKKAAEFQGITPEKALLGMLSKHLISIVSLINSEVQRPDIKVWDEKIIDSINYLILLRAMQDTKCEKLTL